MIKVLFSISLSILILGSVSAQAEVVNSKSTDEIEGHSDWIQGAGPWNLKPGACNQHARIPLPASIDKRKLQTQKAKPVCAVLQHNKAVKRNGEFLDIYKGSNITRWPGWYRDKKGKALSIRRRSDKADMPRNSPFNQPWCYSKSYNVDNQPGKKQWLDIGGLNYKGSLYINGKKVRGGNFEGFYTRKKVDISKYLRAGENQVSFEVHPPNARSLGPSFLDWGPSDPCKRMGLSQEPKFKATGQQTIDGYHVVTKLNKDGSADVTLHLEVDGDDLGSTVSVRLGDQVKNVSLGDLQSLDGEVPFQVSQRDLKLWWPHSMGQQNMTDMEVMIHKNGKESDYLKTQVGLRQVTSFINRNGDRLYRVNGRNLMIRGGGWSGDMLGYEPEAKKMAKLDLLKNMGFNAIRQEGTMEDPDFYKALDKKGIMVFGGFPCCTAWEADEKGKVWGSYFGKWNNHRLNVAADSLRSQLRLMRKHPSFAGFYNGSDFAPIKAVEKRYAPIYANELHGEAKDFLISKASASNHRSSTFGPSGYRMDGPYRHSPEAYWYQKSMAKGLRGPSQGFCSECGPGFSLSGKEALEQMSPGTTGIPSFDNLLQERSGIKVFGGYTDHEKSMKSRMGKPRNRYDYLRKTQIMNYLDHRAQWEACTRGWAFTGACTGIIQWQYDNPWQTPKWNAVSHKSLQTGGSYFGMQAANRPVNIQYGYDNGKITLVNNSHNNASGLTADIKVYDGNSKVVYRDLQSNLQVRGQGGVQLTTPSLAKIVRNGKVKGNSAMVTLDLRDTNGRLVSQNTYPIGKTPYRFNTKKRTWHSTPTISEPNYTSAMKTMGQPGNRPKVDYSNVNRQGEVQVTLANNTNRLSSFNRVVLVDNDGNYIPHQIWSENMVTLHPRSQRQIKVKVDPKLLRNGYKVEYR